MAASPILPAFLLRWGEGPVQFALGTFRAVRRHHRWQPHEVQQRTGCTHAQPRSPFRLKYICSITFSDFPLSDASTIAKRVRIPRTRCARVQTYTRARTYNTPLSGTGGVVTVKSVSARTQARARRYRPHT